MTLPPNALRTLAEAWWSGRHSITELPQSKATGPKLQALCNRDIRALDAAQTPHPSVHTELCDLITLMPDAQVDALLEYIRILREARAIRDGTPIKETP